MSNEITFLTVPADAVAYARRFGAQQDASGQWFVVGEVPQALLNFLPRASKPLFYEVEPCCPRCGSLMQKVRAKSGNLVWLCTAWKRTGCKGILSYEDYLEKVEPVTTLGYFLPKPGALWLPAVPAKTQEKPAEPKPPHPLRERWLDIVRRAFEVFGNERQVMVWLEQPKVALGYKPPIRMLGSPKGCAAVMRLLEEVWR